MVQGGLSGEFIVEDSVKRHAVGGKDLDACVNHPGATAEIGLLLRAVAALFADSDGDVARFSRPVVTGFRPAEGRNETELRKDELEGVEEIGHVEIGAVCGSEVEGNLG